MMCFQGNRGEAVGLSTFPRNQQNLRSCNEDSSRLLSRGCVIASGKLLGPNNGACGSSGGADGGFLSLSVPSRHLLLSNLTWAADQTALEQLFS